MKIFLTGGNGFIGRNILERLGPKYEFINPSHKELELTDAGAVESFFKKHSIDLVVHSANSGGSRKEVNLADVLPINLKIFLNLHSCQKYFGRMIFFGSGAEYDKRRDIPKIREDQFGESVPIDEYGFYKYTCSRIIEKSENITSLRIFGIFGKYEDYEVRFISNAICKTLFDLPITINQNVFFDYVFINDFVKIVEHFILHKPRQKFYNIGTGNKIDLLSLAGIVKSRGNKDISISVKNSGLNKEYTCDNSALMQEIPKLQFTDIKDAVGELYGWYESIKDSLNKEKLYFDK